MGYANPQQSITYSWPEHDFGAGAGAVSFQGPKGMVGKVRDIIVHCTETFTATTTPSYVRLGTGSDADAYAQANLGLLADTDTFVASTDDTDAIIVDYLPADTQVEVAFVDNTGGTPAGKGSVRVIVDWY